VTAADVYSLLNSGGLLAGLILVLFGGWKRDPWWVFGREFRRVEEERDRWRDVAWKGVNVTEKAVDAVADRQ
jgi:hypothetical protein